MKQARAVLILGALVIMGAIFVGCSGSGAEHSNNTQQVTTPAGINDENLVKVQGQAFSPASITTKEGQSITFDGTGTSSSETLCLGSNGTCTSAPEGPTVLSGSGLMLTPGQSVKVLFPHQGTFTVTSPGHAQMNLEITVKPVS